MNDTQSSAASSSGKYCNTGNGPLLQPIEIGHQDYVGLIDPDSAFWSLVRKDKVGTALTDEAFLKTLQKKRESFIDELQALRFGVQPLAVYFNPTERCNLNCNYPRRDEARRRPYGSSQIIGSLSSVAQIL